jgi:hypothetical protein
MSLKLCEKHHRVNILGPIVHYFNLVGGTPVAALRLLLVSLKIGIGRVKDLRWWHQLMELKPQMVEVSLFYLI